MENNIPLIEMRSLSKTYHSSNKTVWAVDDVSLSIPKGKTLGLVGESGSGKSTIGHLLARLTTPTSGSIHYAGEEISSLSNKAFLPYRKKIQLVFQDPYSSLNPRMTIQEIISEPLKIHKSASAIQIKLRVEELLELVGIPLSAINSFPHEFSGGQRQRISIARALALSPEFLILDEPTSALDLSIRAQIINLLKDLQKNLSLTYLFIAHDLAVIKHMSNEVAVMYQGQVVEKASSEVIFSDPLHPYTRSLIHAISIPDPDKERKRLEDFLMEDVSLTSCRPSRKDSHPLKEVKPGHFVADH